MIRLPYQTVLLSILTLCSFGIICSLKTKNLHRIILWFAPINSELLPQRLISDVVLIATSHRFYLNLYRAAYIDTE